nr:iron-containing alcohol dehydrogenase [Candidatus Symbiopectobacterium sp. PLON1]
MAVTNVAELNALVERVKKAQQVFANFTQEQVDQIFRAAALAAADARIPLAKMAVAESGMGIVEDKVIKNHFASEYIYNAYKDDKTCGILSEDDTFGTITIAEPIGLLCGIVPTTNPTFTAIFKALISLKTRNGIIFSPHPRAKNATNKAADIVLQGAIAAGAPKDIIGWIDEPSVELSNQLMHHPDINMILATGGPGMVKAAYSSGKPAIGVGAGNTPVVIDETADIKRAFIVTDRFLFNNGYVDQISSVLKQHGMETDIFFEVEADPTLSIVRKGAEQMQAFKPDVIIALGGGSPMDAAKIMWVMYEHPDTHFEELALRFMDIRKRIYKFPKMGVKAKMIAVTTTSGTGSEVTPFAVVTDDATGQKYPLADYALTPDMAIVDANLVMNMPKSLCAFGGLDAVTNSLGSLRICACQRIFRRASATGIEAAQREPASQLP